MVQYARNTFENIVNKLVMVSLLAIVVLLMLDIMKWTGIILENPTGEYAGTIDIVINSIFVVDLIIIFRRRESFSGFLKKNWLDIIACIPLSNFFRAAKLVRLSRFAKIAARESKAVKTIPKLTRLKNLFLMRGIKAFSKETEVEKQLKETKEKLDYLQIGKLDHELDKIYRIISEDKY